MFEGKDFIDEYLKLGGNVNHRSRSDQGGDKAEVFMVGGSGPYVFATDYLELLLRFKELDAILSANAAKHTGDAPKETN